MRKASSLLYAVAFVSLPSFGGQSLSTPENMSDELLRSSAFQALQKESSDTRFSFSAVKGEQLSVLGRYPLGNDLRHGIVRFRLTDKVTLGSSNDAFGRSVGFSYATSPNGTLHFGAMKSNITGEKAFGVSASFSW